MARRTSGERIVFGIIKGLARAARDAERAQQRALREENRYRKKQAREAKRIQKLLDRERKAEQKAYDKAKKETQKQVFLDYQKKATLAFEERCVQRTKMRENIIEFL